MKIRKNILNYVWKMILDLVSPFDLLISSYFRNLQAVINLKESLSELPERNEINHYENAKTIMESCFSGVQDSKSDASKLKSTYPIVFVGNFARLSQVEKFFRDCLG